MSEKIYPIGIQNFEKIRKDGYSYVDKTALVYQLVRTGSYYFLSRPRRFGKSLLLSTIEAYLLGKKELFEGLAIEQLEKDWIQYPILHLDLNARKYDTPQSLLDELNKHLEFWEQKYHSPYGDRAPEERFYHIVRSAYEQTGQRVVVLVDEYDKPMLQAIGNKALQDEFRNTLKPFYGVLKTMDGCIKFAMLTGVTKFGKVSVFSDLNNLKDISMDKRYVSLCGMTEQEIHRDFEEDLMELAETQGMTYEEVCNKLKEWYDGYQFGNYWFETGTPTYLVELLKRSNYDLETMSRAVTSADVLNSIYGDDEPLPVIFQSGYLTIKDYDEEFGDYTLGYPNKEVEEGFVKFLLPYYASVQKVREDSEIKNLVREVRGGAPDAFLHRLQSFFADTSYELIRDQELHYQNVLYIVFRLIGFYVKAEYHTSQGRIDLVLQTDKYVYVMEFKLEGTAEEALRQIEEKQYALPFASDSRKLFKIGVNFSAQTRNIEKWLIA